VEDEEHHVFRCTKFFGIRTKYPTLFCHPAFQQAFILVVMEYDKKHDDWSIVMKDLIRFLSDAGKVFR
jgi:hypothetical protein